MIHQAIIDRTDGLVGMRCKDTIEKMQMDEPSQLTPGIRIRGPFA